MTTRVTSMLLLFLLLLPRAGFSAFEEILMDNVPFSFPLVVYMFSTKTNVQAKMNTEHTYYTKNGKESTCMAYSKLIKSKVKGLYCPYYIGYIIVDENYAMKYRLYTKFFSVIPYDAQEWGSIKASSPVAFYDLDNKKNISQRKPTATQGCPYSSDK